MARYARPATIPVCQTPGSAAQRSIATNGVVVLGVVVVEVVVEVVIEELEVEELEVEELELVEDSITVVEASVLAEPLPSVPEHAAATRTKPTMSQRTSDVKRIGSHHNAIGVGVDPVSLVDGCSQHR